MRTFIAILFLAFLASMASAQNTFCPQNANCTYTGNSTHSGTETFTGPANFKNLQNVRYVSPANVEGWAGSNAAAWANAAATDLAGAGAVIFRSGTYSIPTGNPILFPADGVSYICEAYRMCFLNGSSFIAGDFFFLMAVNHASVSVSGFVMQCAGSPPSIDIRGITTNNGITSSRGLFENNEIYNCFDGIDLIANSVDNTIRNNYIHNVNQQGITIQGNTNEILNNRIDSVGTTNLHHGMYIQEGVGNLVEGNHVTNVFGFCIHNFSVVTSGVITSTRIIGNYCKSGGLGSGTRGGIAFAETPPSTGNRQGVLTDNTIESTNGNPIYISATTDAVVNHNTVRTYQGDCITVQSSAGFTTTKILVDHNVCQGGTVSGNGIRANVNGGTLQNVIIDHNLVESVFGVGIWLQGCTDCIVSENRVKDYNVQGAFSNVGIRIESTSLRNRINGNIVTTTNVTGAPPALYIVDAASTDNQVFENYIVTSLNGAAYADTGTRNRFFGNHTQVTSGIVEVVTPFSFPAGTVLPSAVNTTDIGSTALPFVNLWLGTAANNNFKLQPAATAAARVISMPDPLGAVNMPYVIASGTTTLTANAALAAVTSQAANTTAATGALTTDSIEWSFSTAPTAGDNLCHVLTYLTAGNVNFVRTNPTAAAQNVSALVINWRVIR